jgi:hypothetical protein
LAHPRWFPYRYAQALWGFLAAKFGDDIAARAIKSRAPGGPWDGSSRRPPPVSTRCPRIEEGSTTDTNPVAQSILSNLDFWRANIGVAVRW